MHHSALLSEVPSLSYHFNNYQVETWWTDAVVGYWLMFGAIIILNLFIALMSDTFQRVFDNAVEVALLERAQIIGKNKIHCTVWATL